MILKNAVFSNNNTGDSFEQYDKSEKHKSKRNYLLKAFTKMGEASTTFNR